MKRQQKPITPEGEQANWQKLDAPHHEAATGFDDLAATLGVLGITPDQWAAANTKAKATRLLKSRGLPQTEIDGLLCDAELDDPQREREARAKVARWASPERRAQVEAGLQRLGFTDNERAVALAVACDGLKVQAAIAAKTGLNRKTVAAILKRSPVRDALKRLQRDESLPTQGTPYKGTPTKGLHLLNCENHARAMLRMTETGNLAAPALQQFVQCHKLPPDIAEWPGGAGVALADGRPPGFLRFLESDQLTAQHAVELVKAHPPFLLYSNCKPLREAFVAVLLAAKYGAISISPQTIPAGKPRSVAAQARKMLAPFTRWPKATGYTYPDAVLAEIVENYRQRIVELQAAWQSTIGQDTVAERLTKFRRQHGHEFDDYSDEQLKQLLTAEKPLTIAARCASRVTDMKPDAFLRAYRAESKRGPITTELQRTPLNPARRLTRPIR
jgi:hypothetical protein